MYAVWVGDSVTPYTEVLYMANFEYQISRNPDLGQPVLCAKIISAIAVAHLASRLSRVSLRVGGGWGPDAETCGARAV